ncbi:uncharacterized protein [Dysidea avara]|uniref:uncharacterized protein isoform X2 n=1 Tax=Dysidea avara TaxID=196820 RepID=UPI003332AC42
MHVIGSNVLQFVLLGSLLAITHQAEFQVSSSVMMEYYFGFFENYEPFTRDPPPQIILTSYDTQIVSYSVEAPGVGYYANGTVTIDNDVIVSFPYAVITSRNDQNKGIYLMISSDRVTVIGQNLRPVSCGTFLCLPMQNLNVDEYVYYGISVPRPNIIEGNGSILIVGTQDNTVMKLTVTQPVTVNVSNSTIDLAVGIQCSFVIKRLQTVLIESLDDLTGTKIVTDKPVSVLSGHQCGRVPNNVDSCEHLVEQVPPTTSWGRIHYIAPLATRRSYSVKIVAAYNSTIVDFYCNNTKESYTIGDGESFNKTLSLQEYCSIYSSKEIIVVQLAHGQLDDGIPGDPTMTLVSSTNHYNSNFHFSTPLGTHSYYYFASYINIIVLAQYYQPDMIYLISGGVNRSLETHQWVPIMVNNVIEAYSIQARISEGVIEVVHQNNIARMFVVAYGWGHHHSYGHPGGYSIFGSSSVMMEYYFGFFENYEPFTRDPPPQIILTSYDTQIVSYSVEAPGVGYYANGTVTIDNDVIVSFPYAVITSRNDQNKGIYLMISSDRVTVIGQNLRPVSCGTFLCLPMQNLNVDEYVYYGISVPRPNIIEGNGSILIVGTQDNTVMKLTVTQPVTVNASNSTIDLAVGIQCSLVIKRLQTVLIESLDDLTGTKIVTDKPVSVLSGHQCGRVPNNVDSCEHLVEQVPPTTSWGRIHYIAPLATRRSYSVKIVAAYNSTIVDFYCNNTKESYTIGDGESFNKTLSLQEYCSIYSSKEIIVVQLAHGQLDDGIPGDPTMTLVSSTNHYNSNFHFSTPLGTHSYYYFASYINIIVLAQYYQPDMIYLISGGVNRSLETHQWVPIMVNNVIEAYSVQARISEGVIEVVHQNNIARMFVVAYGWGHHHSYGHPGGYSIFDSCNACPINFACVQQSDGSVDCINNTDITGCQNVTCVNNGTCVELNDSPTCQCAPGYEGRLCADATNECDPDPCDNRGTCMDQHLDYVCNCQQDITGRNCSDTIDDCVSNPCQNNATCVDETASYTCLCRDGFTGNNCDTNINDCSPNPCKNDGKCMDLVSGYVCDCVSPYTGSNCDCKGVSDETNDELSIGIIVTISVVVTFTVTLFGTILISFIIFRMYPYVLKKTVDKKTVDTVFNNPGQQDPGPEPEQDPAYATRESIASEVDSIDATTE